MGLAGSHRGDFRQGELASPSKAALSGGNEASARPHSSTASGRSK